MRGFKTWIDAPIPVETGFRINGIGLREHMGPQMIDRRAGTGDYLFMCFHDTVRVWEKEGLRDATPPAIVIWEPHHRHLYGNEEKAWDHSWLHCQGPFMTQALQGVQLPFNQAVALPESLFMEDTLIDLRAELTLHRHPDPLILRNFFEIFLRELARHLGKADAAAPMPARLLQVKAWIESNYDQPVTLAELARQAHLSVSHFCHEFKRCFGVAVIDYLIQVRMRAAMHALGNRNLNITEVARLTGYENLYHFSRIFKQRFGMSPKAMRARMAGGDGSAAGGAIHSSLAR